MFYECISDKLYLNLNGNGSRNFMHLSPKKVGLSDSNRIRTHNHLIRKRTLNHLAKLAK